jgi:hypothetical protein
MRKRIITEGRQAEVSHTEEWLDLEEIAEVEITSEDSAHPIEDALLQDGKTGWRAATTGKQTIRLLFLRPQGIRRIRLKFIETNVERTQEYLLRWSPDGGQTFREVVRQQWNFNSPNSTVEEEDLNVDLTAVTVLELNIIADIGGKQVFASMAEMRLA